MADVTLSADKNLSQLTVNNGDRVLLNGHKLTIDAATTKTGIELNNTTNGGTVDFASAPAGFQLYVDPPAFVLTGWILRSGVQLIPYLPEHAGLTNCQVFGGVSGEGTIGAMSGTMTNCQVAGSSTASGSPAIKTNAGTISGGSITAMSSSAITSNEQTITGATITGSATDAFSAIGSSSGYIYSSQITGGAVTYACGIDSNGGIVKDSTITGGSTTNAAGILKNGGVVVDCSIFGSSTSTFASGIFSSTGFIRDCDITAGDMIPCSGVGLFSVIDNGRRGVFKDKGFTACGFGNNFVFGAPGQLNSAGSPALVVIAQGGAFDHNLYGRSVYVIGNLPETVDVADWQAGDQLNTLTYIQQTPIAPAVFLKTWNSIADAADYVLYGQDVPVGRTAVPATNLTNVDRVDALNQFGRVIASGTADPDTGAIILQLQI